MMVKFEDTHRPLSQSDLDDVERHSLSEFMESLVDED
jgi:hypothetical protein